MKEGVEWEGLSGNQLPEPFLLHQQQLKLPVETKRPQVCEKDTCAAAVVAHLRKLHYLVAFLVKSDSGWLWLS